MTYKCTIPYFISEFQRTEPIEFWLDRLKKEVSKNYSK
jgi:hypothetical protein